jgi:uncharacterized protein involved in outer membrane biogenesis
VFSSLSATSKRVLLVIVLVGLYASVGFFVVPAVIKSVLISQIAAKLGRHVAVREVAFNPFELSLTVRGFALPDRDQQTPLIGFEEFHVNFELSSLFNRAFTFKEIRLLLPYVRPAVLRDGHVNLLELAPPASGPSASQEPPRDPNERALPPVIIDLLHVDQGLVEFHDFTKTPPFEANVVPISFTLRNFQTRPGSENPYTFTAEFGKDEVLDWTGTFSLEPVKSAGTIALTGLHARTIWSYVQERLRFEITDGVMAFKAAYKVDLSDKEVQALIADGQFRLTNVKLGEKGANRPLVSVPSLTIEDIDVNVARRDVTIGAITSKDVRVTGWLDKDGAVNLQQLFAPAPLKPEPADQDAQPATRPSRPESTEGEWAIQVKDITIDNYGIAFQDRKPATPVTLTVEPLHLALKDVTWPPKKPIEVRLAMKLNGTGSVSTNGMVSIEPLTADVNLDIAQIAFKPFQPYVDQVAKVTVMDGAANLKGHVRYVKQPTAGPQLSFDGSAGISLFQTKENVLNQELLKWDALLLNGVSVEVEPTKVKIGEVVLQKPWARAVVAPDGSMNVVKLAPEPSSGGVSETPSPAEAPTRHERKPAKNGSSAPSPPVRIDLVRVIDGTLQFADLSIAPPVNTGIQALMATIRGLSSANLSKADIALEAKVGGSAPFKISGKINPLSEEAYSDLIMLAKSIELTAASPYVGKYAGYPITKGQLSLDLQYKLSKKLLEAENKVLVDQLTLGSKTNSADATSLPVPLIVGLLKDRHGRIDIDLPVRGNLNDPDFKYGRALLNVLVNLVTKIAVSPFSALGRLVPGASEEDLKVVKFAPGRAVLSQDEEKKLTALVKALEDRPGLRVEVTGSADPTADRLSLAEGKVRRELQLMRLAELNAEGKEGPTSVEAVELSEADTARLLKELYVKKIGQEPPAGGGEKAGTDQGAALAMMKDKLRDAMTVKDSELQLLAQERAGRIKDFLLKQGSLPVERVFLTEVKLEAKPEQDLVPSVMSLSAI